MSSKLGEKISVCLLTYNHVDLIESTLSSILEQSISGYEVIVSDDCSKDGTWETIQQIACKDPRIRPVRTPYNMGMPGNANFAVAQSHRPYIALLHHDDLYRKDLLEKWVEMMEKHVDVAFVFNSYGAFHSELIDEENIPPGRIDGRWLIEEYLFPRWGCVVRGTAMVRRSAWDEIGGMREKFGLLADVDMWMRLSMRWPVAYVPEPLIIMRHQRPEDYPGEYKSEQWSWRRQTYLYEIHAANRREYLNIGTAAGWLKWAWFRWRLSIETAKWIIYAIVRNKNEMLRSCGASATAYDLWPLSGIRRAVQFCSRVMVTN